MDKSGEQAEEQEGLVENELASVKAELAQVRLDAQNELRKWTAFRRTHKSWTEKQIASLWINVSITKEGFATIEEGMVSSYYILLTKQIPDIVAHIVSEHTSDIVRHEAIKTARTEAARIAHEWLESLKNRNKQNRKDDSRRIV